MLGIKTDQAEMEIPYAAHDLKQMLNEIRAPPVYKIPGVRGPKTGN